MLWVEYLYHIHVTWLEILKGGSGSVLECLESRSEMETTLTSQLTV